jgi:hypothetical protein
MVDGWPDEGHIRASASDPAFDKANVDTWGVKPLSYTDFILIPGLWLRCARPHLHAARWYGSELVGNVPVLRRPANVQNVHPLALQARRRGRFQSGKGVMEFNRTGCYPYVRDIADWRGPWRRSQTMGAEPAYAGCLWLTDATPRRGLAP